MSDSNSSRVPKGILKNKASRFSSAGEGSDVSLDGQLGRQSMNYLGQVPTTSWESDKGQNDLTGISNESKLKDDGLLGLDRNEAVRVKVGEFISRKADMIFKPLGTEDMPVNDGTGLQRNPEDHYGIIPSLDHFLRVDSGDLRRYFFQNVQPGDIVIASIVSKAASGLFLKLMCTDGGKHIVLEDLGIKAFCPSGQMIPAIDPRDPNRVYTSGDLVRCEIIEVPSDSDKLVAGMKGVSLSPEMQHSYLLGLISHYDLPRQFSLARSESESRSRRTYEDLLVATSGFQNPNNINHLASSMGIMSNKNTLMSGLRGSFPSREIGTQLRKIQNGRWAHGNVAEGIRYFKLGKYTEAFQSLNKALSIDAENVEGLVARGALYANNGNYEKAVDDFEVALKFNPSHFNARKYLAETLVAYGKQLDESGKLEDAVASFSKCLVIRPDHRDARDALMSLHIKVGKIDPSKLSGIAATKAIELKEKLNTIRQNELGFKVDEKSKSKKKKRRLDSSGSVDGSSSSSSSDSDSDSSSSDSDSYKGKKKKKGRKKKSKKNKRSKKAIDFKRDLSLSPFSKRLVDPGAGGIPSGSGLAGFGESSVAEWGKQLGIGKPDKQESEDENKRSKKKDKKRSKKSKDKRKKKKHASSENDTSSSDSESSKEKRKSKKRTENQSIEGIIPDLGDLEAKLSAYYSKVEQGKMESMITPQSVKVTVEQNVDKRHNPNAYDNSVRKIEVVPKEENIQSRRQEIHTTAWNDKERIDLRTDDYGNYLKNENIVRTVINEQPEQKPKFEMKIRGVGIPGQGLAPNALSVTSDENAQSELGSKWRKVGAPVASSSYTVTRPDGSAVFKAIGAGSENKPGDLSSGIQKQGIDRSFSNPLVEEKKTEVKRKEQERNYRNKRDSRSRSRSPNRKTRRSSKSRSFSSRSRSRSRGRSRSRSNSRSRSRSFSRSPRRSYSYRGNFRGRGTATRFFRGYSRPLRRPFIPRGNYRGSNDYRVNSSRSRFRNRFSHSPSRSRSRSRPRFSRSRSRSPRKDKDHGRHKSSVDKDKKHASSNNEVVDITKTPEKVSGSRKTPEKGGSMDSSDKGRMNADNEIQIGTLKTTSAADVEELLDKRNAEKKEEMRKSNPDFFRNA